MSIEGGSFEKPEPGIIRRVISNVVSGVVGVSDAYLQIREDKRNLQKAMEAARAGDTVELSIDGERLEVTDNGASGRVIRKI